MDGIVAIGVGLVLRIVVDVATDNDDRVGGVLVGLWEGVVLNHFVRQMPHSYDPYLGFGFRIFVDFLFTQSISRLALVALWALVGMLLADIAPNVWRDSGLRHLYRQVRKDVRHVKRSVPRIRIKNDLPSVRLFNRSRSSSAEVSNSIRSDIATPSRSTAPSPTPTPDPARRPGRSPPGTFPDVSGWSETATDISTLQERRILHPRPSPSLTPSREHAEYERMDTTHATSSQAQTTVVQDTTITITQTQSESVSLETIAAAATIGAAATSMALDPIDEPLPLDPPTIPDDWVDINHPAPAHEPVVPFQSDPDSTPEPQQGPLTPATSRPPTILDPPPVIDVRPNTPDIDAGDPEQIPLPESRAASVIGGVYDQPQPRSVLRDSFRSRVDKEKATSEIGVDYKSVAQTIANRSTRTQSSSRSWTGFFGRPKSVNADADARKPPSKETLPEQATQSRLDVSSTAPGPEPQLPTPAQVDPPANILGQTGNTPPLLLAQVEPDLQGSKLDPPPASAGVDSSPAPLQGEADKGDDAGPSKTSLFDIPSPPRSPPPPFTEFAGVPEGPAAGEAPAEEDPVTQDELLIELTEEQKAAEAKRLAFLSIQIEELRRSLADLRKRLDKEDNPTGDTAKAIETDIKDMEKTVDDVKARMAKKKFSEPPLDPVVQEISIANKSIADVQFEVTSAVLNELLGQKDAGPVTFVVPLPKKAQKKNQLKDTLTTFAKRHDFKPQFDNGNSTLSITF